MPSLPGRAAFAVSGRSEIQVSTLLLSVLVLCACGSQPDVLDKPAEDTEGLQVFRREGAPLAPARGRVGFTVHPDGAFVFIDIGPGDGHLPQNPWTAGAPRPSPW